MGVTPSIGSLQTVRGERHFTEAFDKERTGTCSKVEFKIGLERSVSVCVFPTTSHLFLRSLQWLSCCTVLL